MFARIVLPTSVDRWVDEFFEDQFFGRSLVRPASHYPALDIVEYDNESVLIAEMPGVKKEDLSIKVEDGMLTISGERRPYEIPQNARVILNEMRVQEFSRSIEFPHPVDVDRISAELQNGVLRITLPKSEEARVRTVEIK